MLGKGEGVKEKWGGGAFISLFIWPESRHNGCTPVVKTQETALSVNSSQCQRLIFNRREVVGWVSFSFGLCTSLLAPPVGRAHDQWSTHARNFPVTTRLVFSQTRPSRSGRAPTPLQLPVHRHVQVDAAQRHPLRVVHSAIC